VTSNAVLTVKTVHAASKHQVADDVLRFRSLILFCSVLFKYMSGGKLQHKIFKGICFSDTLLYCLLCSFD